MLYPTGHVLEESVAKFDGLIATFWASGSPGWTSCARRWPPHLL